MNATSYPQVLQVSQVALYIGSKAVHLCNCLFASLPESH